MFGTIYLALEMLTCLLASYPKDMLTFEVFCLLFIVNCSAEKTKFRENFQHSISKNDL
jgi:hypothetical protein